MLPGSTDLALNQRRSDPMKEKEAKKNVRPPISGAMRLMLPVITAQEKALFYSRVRAMSQKEVAQELQIAIEQTRKPSDVFTWQAKMLAERLTESIDIAPQAICDEFDLPQGTTWGEVGKHVLAAGEN
jgi:hypothetical protein